MEINVRFADQFHLARLAGWRRSRYSLPIISFAGLDLSAIRQKRAQPT
jgi:hypothetical protein